MCHGYFSLAHHQLGSAGICVTFGGIYCRDTLRTQRSACRGRFLTMGPFSSLHLQQMSLVAAHILQRPQSHRINQTALHGRRERIRATVEIFFRIPSPPSSRARVDPMKTFALIGKNDSQLESDLGLVCKG